MLVFFCWLGKGDLYMFHIFGFFIIFFISRKGNLLSGYCSHEITSEKKKNMTTLNDSNFIVFFEYISSFVIMYYADISAGGVTNITYKTSYPRVMHEKYTRLLVLKLLLSDVNRNISQYIAITILKLFFILWTAVLSPELQL